MNSPHKGPATRKMFPFDDVIIWPYACESWTPNRATVSKLTFMLTMPANNARRYWNIACCAIKQKTISWNKMDKIMLHFATLQKLTEAWLVQLKHAHISSENIVSNPVITSSSITWYCIQRSGDQCLLMDYLKLQCQDGLWAKSINSLWFSDAIWRYISGSTLAKVMACCLTIQRHCPNQCWLGIVDIHPIKIRKSMLMTTLQNSKIR